MPLELPVLDVRQLVLDETRPEGPAPGSHLSMTTECSLRVIERPFASGPIFQGEKLKPAAESEHHGPELRFVPLTAILKGLHQASDMLPRRDPSPEACIACPALPCDRWPLRWPQVAP